MLAAFWVWTNTVRQLGCSKKGVSLCWALVTSVAHYVLTNYSRKSVSRCSFILFFDALSPLNGQRVSPSAAWDCKHCCSSLVQFHLSLFVSGHSEQPDRYFPGILCEDHKASPRERLRRGKWRPHLQLSALLSAHPLRSRNQVCSSAGGINVGMQ